MSIRVGGFLWGALGAVSLEGGRLTEDAEERLSRFAELAGLAVANAEARAAAPPGAHRPAHRAGWLMPGTPLQGARAAAERFRSAVADEGFGPVPGLTVSVGVAQLTDLGEDGSSLFRRADAALFAAKAAGRDRTMAAEPA